MDIQATYRKWLGSAAESEITDQLNAMTEPEIADAFYRDLEFGTGGLRGLMGAGTNRMNIYTVNRATQGLCNFLKSQKMMPTIAIAFDSRIKSEDFARSAAGVLAANGAKALIFSELTPTPALSYAVRELKCDAGIVITASHNPAEYNGYKVYGSDGCQITLRAAETIQKHIEAVDIFTGVKKKLYEDAVREGSAQLIPTELLETYLDRVLSCSIHPALLKDTDLSVIYTPLNGTGNKPVREILAKAGLKNLAVVPEQKSPDGHFTTCPKPNPEEPSAYSLAVKFAEKHPADLLLATDPDCDRIGAAVKSGSEYVLLTGNETGCLLLDYILSQKKAMNSLPEKPVIVKTIVTGDMANCIAKEYGARVIDTLTGFKYIGEQIGLLEKENDASSYVFGFEESYGYLPEIFARDKDAVSAALLICEMAAFYKKNHQTLKEALENLYEKHGFWKHKLLPFSFEGAEGMKKMQTIMGRFRKGDFTDYAGLSVVKTDDYLKSVTVNRETPVRGLLFLPKSDVMAFSLEKDCKIIVRPSGTEPKLKCYLTVRSNDNYGAVEMLKALEADLTHKIQSF
jgi:phosphoglucomutase